MKSYKKELWFHTQKRREYLNITRLVQDAISDSGIQEGIAPRF